MMLFRKKIEKSCSYFQYSAELDGGQMLCSKKGLTSEDGQCMKFRYDPTKRVPSKQKALDFSKYDKDDFSL